MNKVPTKPKTPAIGRKLVQAQISKLREQMEDMQDYLTLLDARARNEGKPTLSLAEMKRKVGKK
jgi:hypothetical protein